MGGASATYDARGNLTTDPVTGKTYSYLSANNQLYVVSSPWASHSYDALGRLVTISNGGIDTNYVADGDDMIAEYDGSNVLQKRYAFDGADSPLVQYDGAGNRTWLMPDERGSIVALANDSGTLTALNTYDEYGNPGASNTGAFQYTGQLWLSRAGQYWYRSRTYGQNIGRFSQTDPIGYNGDGPNLYAYVLNDPVNFIDPFGFDLAPGYSWCGTGCTYTGGQVVITAGAYPSGSLDFSGLFSTVSSGGRFGKNLGKINLPSRQQQQPKQNQCAASPEYTTADAARDVGEVVGDLGALAEIGGLAVGAVAPPVGGAIAFIGGVASYAGSGIVLAADVSQGRWAAAGGDLLSFAAGGAAGRVVGTLGKGAWRDVSTGRFVKNPLGGQFRKAKEAAARLAGEKFTGKAIDTIRCAH